jgi:uncharacterized protein YrrD
MSEQLGIKTSDLVGKRVFARRPTKKNPDGIKKLGHVRAFVFSPDALVCVGFLVKRPDVVLMFRREDDFVAINGFDLIDGDIIIKADNDAFGRGATKALAIPLDKCVLWEGLPVMTENGAVLGIVGSINLELPSGRVTGISLSKGATANALLGKVEIPREMIRGFKLGIGARLADANPRKNGGVSEDEESEQNYGALLVSNEAVTIEAAGGVAKSAGAATAKVAHKAKEVGGQAKEAVKDAAKVAEEKAAPTVKAATAKAGKAINKGAYATGRQLGRTTGMFKGFKDSLEKAMKDDD